MSAMTLSLPFEPCRDSCRILSSKAWPSGDVLLGLSPLSPLLLPRPRWLLALSLALFSAPSALSPVET